MEKIEKQPKDKPVTSCTIGEKEFLNLNEACAWVGVTATTIYEWRKKGLKYLKIGGVTRYSKKHLTEFMEAYEQ